jgi:hypothetical protein
VYEGGCRSCSIASRFKSMRPTILSLAGDTYALDRSTKTNYPAGESKTTVSAAPSPVAQYSLVSQSGSHGPSSFSQSPSQASSSGFPYFAPRYMPSRTSKSLGLSGTHLMKLHRFAPFFLLRCSSRITVVFPPPVQAYLRPLIGFMCLDWEYVDYPPCGRIDGCSCAKLDVDDA